LAAVIVVQTVSKETGSDLDGCKLSCREKEAVSPRREEQPYDLTPVVDAGRNRLACIGYIDELKS
jgi:hypothetical protein